MINIKMPFFETTPKRTKQAEIETASDNVTGKTQNKQAKLTLRLWGATLSLHGREGFILLSLLILIGCITALT